MSPTRILLICPQNVPHQNFADLPTKCPHQDMSLSRCLDTLPNTLLWLVGRLTSKQQASVSQGHICADNRMCCHTETEVADQTSYLTQSQYTDTRPTSPSPNYIRPCAWQGSHCSAYFAVSSMTQPGKISMQQARIDPWMFCSQG